MSPQPKPRYPHQRIQSVASLSAALSVPEGELVSLAKLASSQYRPARPITKPDGSVRQPLDALPALKRVQRQIQARLLRKVKYPPYLTGSLPGGSPRANAILHAAPAIVISEDIARFFPTTRSELVYRIWAEFFGFSAEVADILTALTTKDGFLPEGSRTSSYLANLVFWDCEPVLVEQLAALGARYSRYVDDVTLSSANPFTPAQTDRCIALVYGMFGSRGYKAKRSKHEIVRANAPMRVTKLVVNKRPALPKNDRKAVRTAVYELEGMVNSGLLLPKDIRNQLNSVSGRVSRLSQFHPTMGAQLKARVSRLREQLAQLNGSSTTMPHQPPAVAKIGGRFTYCREKVNLTPIVLTPIVFRPRSK